MPKKNVDKTTSSICALPYRGVTCVKAHTERRKKQDGADDMGLDVDDFVVNMCQGLQRLLE